MKNARHACDLQSCVFCKLCLPEWLPAIDFNRKTVEFKKGEVIFSEGDEVKGMYFVFNGLVKVHKKWGEEKELILRFAHKGDIFGHRGLGNNAVYPISATALEPVTACFIELDFFKASLKVNHEYALQLTMFLADELMESEKNMRNLAHMNVKGRVANALIKLANKFGLDEKGQINVQLSRQDIASYTGTTYETVFRVMSDFNETNLINTDGREITILDLNGLLEFTNKD
ncbi:MAG: Crp/Fnr family transcriptional regulator [Chitinophagaceae bacterium]